MRNAFGLSVSVFLLILPGAPATAAPIFNTGNGHYYELVDDSLTWLAARDAAAAMTFDVGGVTFAGHLVTITSEAERMWIDASWPANTDIWFDPTNPLWNHWLGASQPANQATPDASWAWVTGEAWGYTNWYRTEPNDNAGATPGVEDNEENFAAFVPLNQWFDYGDGQQPGYLVEFEPTTTPVPEPATWLLAASGLAAAWARRRQAR